MTNIEPIETDSQINTKYKSVIDRYFVKRYHIGNQSNEDICILEHSNKICIVTLSHFHPIVSEKKKIAKIDFEGDEARSNRLNIKVKGKQKKGAQWMNMSSSICQIICEDGSTYSITIGFKANIIEINNQLVNNPQLLVDKTDTNGYIAILLTKQQDHIKEMNKLLSVQDYEEYYLNDNILTIAHS